MIDWDDNARAAVEYFADWLRADYSYIANLDDFYSRLPQTKTVADAVGALTKEELTGGWEQIRYAPKQNYFFTDMNRDKWFDTVHVCTRAEFESYVKEQEGEKWTHTVEGSIKCALLCTHGDTSWVLEEGGVYETYFSSCIEPIKPTISEVEAWRLVSERDMTPSKVKEKYEVV